MTKSNKLIYHFLRLHQYLTAQDNNNTHIVHSLCGFDNVPCAIVINMVFTANILTVAMVVMTLGFDFLERRKKKRQGHRDKDKLLKISYIIRIALKQAKCHGKC